MKLQRSRSEISTEAELNAWLTEIAQDHPHSLVQYSVSFRSVHVRISDGPRSRLPHDDLYARSMLQHHNGIALKNGQIIPATPAQLRKIERQKWSNTP